MDNGFLVSGLYVGSDEATYGDGRTMSNITVAIGSAAYKVFMKDGFRTSSIDGIAKFGTPIVISCKPYVSKKGGIGFGNGEICDIG